MALPTSTPTTVGGGENKEAKTPRNSRMKRHAPKKRREDEDTPSETTTHRFFLTVGTRGGHGRGTDDEKTLR